jgi:hypothetical protein
VQPGDRRLHRAARVLALPGQRLQQHQSERVHVRRRRDVVAAHLLGGHVRGRPDDHAGVGDLGGPVEPGDAEVGQPGAVVAVEQDVGRLDVAVHDAALVHVGQRVGQLRTQRRDVGRVHRSRAQRVGEAAPVDQVGDDVALAVGGAGVEERDQARVPQRAEDAHLAAVAPGVGGGRAGGEQLDRHVLAAGPVERAVHGGGAAAAELRADLVAPVQHGTFAHSRPPIGSVSTGTTRGDALSYPIGPPMSYDG